MRKKEFHPVPESFRLEVDLRNLVQIESDRLGISQSDFYRLATIEKLGKGLDEDIVNDLREAVVRRNLHKNKSLVIDVEGHKISLVDLARVVGISYEILRRRIFEHKWSVGDAIATPARRYKRRDR